MSILSSSSIQCNRKASVENLAIKRLNHKTKTQQHKMYPHTTDFAFTNTMHQSFSSPQITLKSLARFQHAQMKAQKRGRPVKHAKPCKAKKSVSFSSFANVTVREISREELNKCWIQPAEYSQIEEGRKRCLATVKEALLGRAPSPDPSEYCIHGLEQQLSPKQVLERKIKNMQYRRLLLQEQHAQRCCGASDPQALQNLSELFSQQATRRALRRALSTEENALAA